MNNFTDERHIRIEITKLLGDPLIKGYRRINIFHSILDFAIIYFMLFLVMFSAVLMHMLIGPWVLLFTPFFVLLSGAAFNWINVQIHEASHYLLLPKRVLNDVYCNLFFGTLGLQDIESYRATHAMHHAFLHTNRDPDLHVYDNSLGFYKALINDLFLISAFQRQKEVKKFLIDNGLDSRNRKPAYMWVVTLMVQLGVISIFFHFCGFWGIVYYFSFWLYGLLAIFPLLVRVRTTVQHYSIGYDQSGTEMGYTSRSTEASLVEFLLIGARMDYHFEHHLFPAIPYYGLKLVHRELKRRGVFGDRLNPIWNFATNNYLETFFRLKIKGRIA